MITQINLEYFKCFEKLKLPLAPLTLLTGTNASGKSSILHALVLLNQTMREHEWSMNLMLNGSLLQLGTVSDVIDKVNGRKSFSIALSDDEQTYRWDFNGEREEMSMSIDCITIGNNALEKIETLRHLLPPEIASYRTSITNSLLNLSYITAERLGPRETYAFEDRFVSSVVGPTGEHAVSLLHWGRDKPIIEKLSIPGIPNTRLRQVEERMRTFFPGCNIQVQQVPNANLVTLGIRASEDTNFHRPIHAGFGLTQVFPIIVAALSSDEGNILLIENPEVHLHPAAQALMGQFLANVVQSGIQVVVETHSDHILNGIRRSVKAKMVNPDQVKIYFFRPRSDNEPQVETPQINEKGDVDFWPDGFFDQFDKDMNYFAGWGV